MKKLLVSISFLLLAITTNAQVYTIKPIYEITTIENKKRISLYSIDSFSTGNFVVDLDKMILSNPGSPSSRAEIIPIIKFTRLDNNLLKFKLKKKYPSSPDTYYLQLDEADKPLYILIDQNTFTTYTTIASAVTLRFLCSRFYKVEVPYTNGAPAPMRELKEIVAKTWMADGDNIFELKNGIVTWTEGKGKNGMVHKFVISSSKVSTERGHYFIQLEGNDEAGNLCAIVFYESFSEHPYTTYVTLDKIEGNRWTRMYFR